MMATVPISIPIVAGAWLVLSLLPLHLYLIYPCVCVWWAWRSRTEESVTTVALPPLVVVCVYHNERAVLPAKLQNTLALDYPGLTALFVSDASDDGSDELVRRESRVTLVRCNRRQGKPNALDTILREQKEKLAAGTVILLTDANTILDQAAARLLAVQLSIPSVKFACGRLILKPSGNPLGDWEQRYWEAEQLFKRGEGAKGWLVGANGGLWAFRIGDYPGLGTDKLVMEDLLIPLRLFAGGGQGVYVEAAVGTEGVAPTDEHEFSRRLRIARADFSMLSLLLRLPLSSGVRFCLWSHKILRWFFPLLSLPLVMAPMIGWLLLAGIWIDAWLFLLLIVFLYVILLGKWKVPGLAGLRYGVAIHTAFVIAGIEWLLGKTPLPYWDHGREDAAPSEYGRGETAPRKYRK